MSDLAQIRKPIEKEMADFEDYFSRTMRSNIPLLNIILNYILRRKGKQMRPLLVFLTARLHGTISEPTYVAATFIELLHTASLVHDDVVDDASERRGALSINALWNSKIAVLVGDYMLSKGMLISVEKERYDMLGIISEAVRSMSEGELFQLQKSRKLNITEEDYFRIITSKTAALLAACTACGARSVSEDPDTVQLMKDFGENIGIAFQIRDDILDYQPTGLTGKIAGNDIKEKKITLPLIHVLENSPGPQKKHILGILKNKKKNNSQISEVIRFVTDNGGLDYSEMKMNLYRDKALAILDTYPQSDVRESLKSFVNYTTLRKK
ncbi:MAG TPA: polyprenyl synthetase family protein [Bacteroidales bacterium]|nr:polyprenyl synthetase family protein [Bacteroidales bacterium]